ncbi:MAG: NUDIX hydrolase [Gammaproteobacteria bacterium]|nr:NUDIX hydrolase [Gammaproteobacteria bacterium]MDE2346566.1 NUDIX hydrolase [Gammaproteobacteria bacterium]
MAYTYEYPHLAVTTDVAVFTLQKGELHVLLIRRGNDPFRGAWALPGGFVRPEEGLEDCARRELEEETGVSGFYLEQLYTFGAVQRDPRERVLTVAYFALIPSDRVVLKASADADAVAWFPANRLPELAFDHRDILKAARERLAAKLDYSTIAFQFMPAVFTLSELQTVYETIKGEKLDKRNFRKSILALKRLETTGKYKREGAHRPAMLYRIKARKGVEIIK